MPIVLDASVALAICFRDEQTEEVLRVARSLVGNPALVPSNWPLEVGNGLLVAERRGRLTEAASREAKTRLAGLPIVIDGSSLERTLDAVLSVARAHGLTIYDASYLELAMKEALPLATLDADLRDAAKRAGVELAL